MKFIADTHAFLWFVTDATSLSPTAKRLLEAPDSDRLLSIASIWEIAIKHRLGKLNFAHPLDEFLPTQISVNQFRLLNISLAHTLKVTQLPLHHRDPFDRMLVAQALSENLPVLSNDSARDAYGVKRLW
ncbi:MAG: hypothetical protein RLZZ350_1831 [Verrucomicrobiota bacterium]|jgi:PIN domain nuclease of toxin-antitoxin system